MRWIACAAAATLLVGLVMTSTARAEAFDPKQIPAEAKWVLHVNADTALKSPLWDLVKERLDRNMEFQAKRQEMEQILGMRLPEDVHGVTLYGLGFGDTDAVFILDATMNQQQLRGMLQMNPSYSSSQHGDHEVLSWDDKGKINYGAFYGGTKAIIAGKPENVELALDALDGKKGAFKGPAPIEPANAQTSVLAYVSAESLAELKGKDPNNPFVDLLQSAVATLSQDTKNTIIVRANAQAVNAEAAEKMRVTLEGVKAMVSLMASKEQADAKVKLAAAALEKLQAKVNQTVVEITWQAPAEQVKTLVEKAEAVTGQK